MGPFTGMLMVTVYADDEAQALDYLRQGAELLSDRLGYDVMAPSLDEVRPATEVPRAMFEGFDEL